MIRSFDEIKESRVLAENLCLVSSSEIMDAPLPDLKAMIQERLDADEFWRRASEAFDKAENMKTFFRLRNIDDDLTSAIYAALYHVVAERRFEYCGNLDEAFYAVAAFIQSFNGFRSYVEGDGSLSAMSNPQSLASTPEHGAH